MPVYRVNSDTRFYFSSETENFIKVLTLKGKNLIKMLGMN